MTMNNVRGFSYNPMTNTLALTANFVKKASRLGTTEYKMVLQYQKDHPGLEIVELKKDNEHKRDTVTYTRMEQTIKLCRDSEARMKQYKQMRIWAEIQDAPFLKLKAWFLNNYANYDSMDDIDDEGFFLPKTKAEVKAEAEEKAKEAQTSMNDTISENN
ncbi:MAG: hypothetical protein PUC00_11935 [Clostridiales bacterium]|nr:hypothetical protein [Clostridiales bacterium]